MICLAGWLNQQQRDAIDYLQEESRMLREQPSGKRLQFSDDQRRRLAAYVSGRSTFCQLVTSLCDLHGFGKQRKIRGLKIAAERIIAPASKAERGVGVCRIAVPADPCELRVVSGAGRAGPEPRRAAALNLLVSLGAA